MIYSLRGAAFAMVAVAGLSTYACVNRSMNYKPAKASVFLIDRKCQIIETKTDFEGKKSTSTFSDDCKTAEQAWDKAKAKHDKTIVGSATVKVTYNAPQDGSYQTGELHFSSRDDEFYDLKAGDEIDVLVNNDDHGKVIKG
jgi:hypothetical protein